MEKARGAEEESGAQAWRAWARAVGRAAKAALWFVVLGGIYIDTWSGVKETDGCIYIYLNIYTYTNPSTYRSPCE
jgi:hypothetical protein